MHCDTVVFCCTFKADNVTMKFLRTLLSLSLCVLIGTSAFSQTNSENIRYKTYDRIVGLENTGLYNGTEFTDPYLNTNGTYRYYNGFDYTRGSVTYNGQYYADVFLKYDLLEDNLLSRSDDNLSVFNVKLIPDFVESFSIHGHNFVRLPDAAIKLGGNGFYEVAYLGNDTALYIKHNKKMRDKALKKGMQYSFLNANYYLLKYHGAYTVVRSQRDFRKLFPEKSEEIRKFFKSFKTMYRSDPDAFMVQITKYLDGPNTNTNI